MIARGFSACPLNGLVITKTDEAAHLGAAFNLMLETGLPLTFVTTGQRVPEESYTCHAGIHCRFDSATRYKSGRQRTTVRASMIKLACTLTIASSLIVALASLASGASAVSIFIRAATTLLSLTFLSLLMYRVTLPSSQDASEPLAARGRWEARNAD